MLTVPRFLCLTFALLLAATLASPAQQPPSGFPMPAVQPPSRTLDLDVVVTAKSGQPVLGLNQQDFTILDNKSPRPITSFSVATPADHPVKVILFIDAVNIPYSTLAFVRNGVDKFLRANDAKLAYSTAIAILTDNGAEIGNAFTTDGNVLADSLQHQSIGIRQITRSSQWGGSERLQICLNAFHQLVDYASTLPGRKVVLWISSGWPLLSGPNFSITAKQQEQIFDNIVYFSSRMRQAGIALYNINPLGASESLVEASYYQGFLKGVSKPGEVQYGNLGLQVLALHSGGLALESSNDVTGLIQECVAENRSWYRIGFDPTPADKPNEYHHIEVKLDQHGLTARTRDGYYANPTPVSASR